MTEHTIAVISEAQAASHMPAIPDVPDAGTWSASVTAVADIEAMSVDDMVDALAIT